MSNKTYKVELELGFSSSDPHFRLGGEEQEGRLVSGLDTLLRGCSLLEKAQLCHYVITLLNPEKCLGQLAFDAYNKDRGGINHLGKKTPEWDELPVEIQHAWKVAAKVVESQVLSEVMEEVT